MKQNTTLEQVLELLRTCQRCIVMSHVYPDPDAYGSLCSLAHILQANGKEVYCANESAPADHLEYLRGDLEIHNTLPAKEDGDWDLVVTLDCGDGKRVGDTLAPELASGSWKILNIDHHASNDFFGHENYVLPEASSTCEILFELFLAGGYTISADIAELLLAGIIADSGSFRYSCTSSRTLEIGSQLVALGATTESIGRKIWGSVPLSAVKLQSEALLGMEFFADQRVAIVTVTEEMLGKHGATIDATENLTERARDIEGVVLAASIREVDDIWKVSLRSEDTALDVSVIAKKFGGGGHKPAAAFRWKRDYKTLKEQLVSELVSLVG